MAPTERREAILDCAATLALENGLERLTARQIAETAGVAPGLLNHYFETLDILIAEAFERALEADFAKLQEFVDGGSDPGDRLVRFIDVCLAPERVPFQQLWLGAWAEANRNQALKQRLLNETEAWEKLIAELVDDALDGRVIDGRSPESIARRLSVIVDGFVVQGVMRSDSHLDADLRGLACAIVEHELEMPAGTLNQQRV